MKLVFSYKFLFYLFLVVILVYISLKYFNVTEGNRTKQLIKKNKPEGNRSRSSLYQINASRTTLYDSSGNKYI